MVHYQQEMAKSLVHLTPIVVVCAGGVRASYFPRGVPRYSIDIGRGPVTSFLRAASPLTWYRLIRILRSLQVDVFHIVAPHEWNPIVACAVRATGRPLIYTVHDSSPHSGAPARMRIANSILVKMADALVVLTRHARNQLIETGIAPAKIHVIPMMAHLAFAAQSQGRLRARKSFLFFGRIEPYKGLGVLLSAFQRIHLHLDGWKLVIAGNGALPRGVLPQDARSVRLLNRHIPDEEVARLMKGAGVVVLPYIDATQSSVIALAAAFGKPVIVTRVGGLPEMVIQGKTGLIVPPNDARALSRAMVSLARHPARLRKMGQQARELGRSRWSPGAVSRLHLAAYESVLRSTGG